jgi:uroporphyrinogen decarboxylase
MNSKERVLRAIHHQPIDRTPTYFFGTRPINQRLAERLDVPPDDEEALLQRLDVDVRYIRPIFCPVPGEDRHEFSYGDIHAIIQHEDGYRGPAPRKRMLDDVTSAKEVLDHPGWPSPDWYDYQIPEYLLPAYRDKAIVAYDMGILFLYAMGVRGMVQLCIDMASEPEIAEAIFFKIGQYNLERTRRFLEANKGMIDIVGLGDDVAGQEGMIISPRMWREMIGPHVQAMVDLCHESGVIPYFHGCGGFRALFDTFVEMGIACVGRLQTEAKGNNFSEIKAEFGDRLCLWGAIDGQHVLVEGSVEDVRAHVEQVQRIGQPTGFIAGPTHSFTEDTPIDNILAAYEVLRH